MPEGNPGQRFPIPVLTVLLRSGLDCICKTVRVGKERRMTCSQTHLHTCIAGCQKRIKPYRNFGREKQNLW
ncbi:hypothetical protein BX592_107251 [Paraburkholderia rhizosphaerae]|uniref:Uncharacterized protein n=1 Tax=Paraburkholderia rhizosphaerae TaxID=480658 RepID=A0A4R8LV50_9BURK|nr:hypothetical protein BX592_107251 [Paraburkholderia rhizosphaerae]